MSVENERLLLWYKNEEKYINDSAIASLLQDMLNTAAEQPLFKVYIDNKSDTYSQAYDCTLKTRIEPYMLKGAHCENVYVRLSIKYPVENEQEKIKVLNIITKCLGFITGEFKCTDMKSGEALIYTFCSNFTKEETGTPENINSHYTGTLTVKGNMHITRSDGGLLGDMVENIILVGGVDYPIVGRTVEGSWQAVTDSPIKSGSFRPETEYNAVSNAKTLIILFRNDYICNLLRDYAQGILADSTNPFINSNSGRPELTLKEVYPDKTVQDTYYIYEVKESREAGNYMAISVALIKQP